MAVALTARAFLAYTVQEVYHLIQILFCIHLGTAMAAIGYEGCLCLDTCRLQKLEEHLSLTTRYHIILLTMEDDDWRIVGSYIVCSTQAAVLIRFLCELGILF